MMDRDLLAAARRGYELQISHAQQQIDEIDRRLRIPQLPPPVVRTPPEHAAKKHKLTAEGRARIAAAQKQRWAAAKAVKARGAAS